VSAPQAHQTRGDILAQVTDAMVQLHKEYYGKGPTKAKTFLVDNTLLCLLEGGFTVVEKTLIDAGRAAAVHDVRHSFQSAMEQPFVRVVEEILERKVLAYMSQVHTDPDIAAELFVLEPRDQPLERGEYERSLEPE
jgi:uncharacterized protein YbcI